MSKQTKVWLVLTIALSLLALGSACSKSSETPPSNGGGGTESAGPYSGPTGSIAGVVSFEGTPAPAIETVE